MALNQFFFMYEFAVAPAVTQIRRRGVEITDVAPESLAADWDICRAPASDLCDGWGDGKLVHEKELVKGHIFLAYIVVIRYYR